MLLHKLPCESLVKEIPHIVVWNVLLNKSK